MSKPTRQKIAFGLVLVVALYAAGIGTKNQTDIRRIEPQVTQIVRATAACKAEALRDAARRRACAKRIRIGLSACRQDLDCRVAFLALIDAAEREEVVPGGKSPSGLEPGQGTPSGPENPSGPPPSSPGSGPNPHPNTSPPGNSENGAPGPEGNPPGGSQNGPPGPAGNPSSLGKSAVDEVQGTVDKTVDKAQGAVDDVVGKACSTTGDLRLC